MRQRIEKAFADVRDEFTPAGPQLRISVMGRPTALNPAVHEQVYLIGREALIRNSHWGLVGMHERAKNIGGQLRIWSRKGAGTEVEVSIPNDLTALDVISQSNQQKRTVWR